MKFSDKMQKNFDLVSDSLFNDLKSNEDLILNLSAEDSTFIRFNNNQVRQNTSVEQINLHLQLHAAGKTSQATINLTGNTETDIKRTQDWLNCLRKECLDLPEDHHQVPVVNNGHSKSDFQGKLLADSEIIEAIVTPAKGSDLAGLYCGGPILRANKNSKGQNHWFSTESFFMDYSLYNGSKAAKSAYAGSIWNQNDFENNLSETRNQLSLLNKPKKAVPRGEYRTYLAPGAVSEILTHFGWGCMGYGDYKRGNSAFKKLIEGEKQFSDKFTLKQNFKLGLMPRFNSSGELSAETLDLITNGKLNTLMISSRTAKEYGVTSNFAEDHEAPLSAELMPGTLKRENILKELGTGLYLSNLHYINWSDRQTARITGMTRYACFWVENGEIIAPIEDLRFDESLYDCFGQNLVNLTDFQEIEQNVDTYDARHLGGKKMPGALINNFKFTL